MKNTVRGKTFFSLKKRVVWTVLCPAPVLFRSWVCWMSFLFALDIKNTLIPLHWCSRAFHLTFNKLNKKNSVWLLPYSVISRVSSSTVSQDTWVLLRTRRLTREKASAHWGSRIIPASGLELRFRNSRLGMLDTILLIWKQDNNMCFNSFSSFSHAFPFPFSPDGNVNFTQCEQIPLKDSNSLWPSAPGKPVQTEGNSQVYSI